MAREVPADPDDRDSAAIRAVPKQKGNESLIPKQGERAFIVGQTGSGKTQFACWLLERLKQSPIVVYDTKGERMFETLPRSILVHDIGALEAALNNESVDYIIFRVPPFIVANNEDLDNLLWHHFQNYRGADVYIDEVFSFSQNGRAGPGLVALLTQGRSHGFTTIMSAQRPAWLSRFVISEAQRYYAFRLVDKKDRARLGDVIPDFADLPSPPAFGYYYFEAGQEAPRLMAPILLDKKKSGAYKQESDQTDPADRDELTRPDPGTQLNWI